MPSIRTATKLSAIVALCLGTIAVDLLTLLTLVIAYRVPGHLNVLLALAGGLTVGYLTRMGETLIRKIHAAAWSRPASGETPDS